MTDTKEVESDYPGMLSDVLSAVQESAINVLNTQKDISELRNSISGVADATNIVSELADNIKAFIGYDDEQILGLEADFENNTFTRLAGARGMNAGADFNIFSMYGGRRRCNVSDSGNIMAFYGDESFREDGTNGQVMVYQPKFYYRVVPTKLEKNENGLGYHIRKANYYICETAKMGFKLHPAFYDANGKEIDYILYSAYEGSMFDASKNAYVNDNVDVSIAYASGDLLCSVAGNKPISGFKGNLGTKANLEAMANNRGEGWHLETIKATSANQLLMIIELGTMNVQSSIARGITDMSSAYACNCSSLTGSTAELGNATGQATETVSEIDGSETVCTTEGQLSVSYRGIENPWGNIWKHIQGINIWGDGTMGGGQPYVANNFAFNESKNSDNYQPVGFTLANAMGYIKAMGYGDEDFDWLFMPSEIGGTSMLPVGDGAYVSTNLNGYRVALFGGAWYYGNDAGAFYWYCNNGVNACSRIIGGRLVYIPTAK